MYSEYEVVLSADGIGEAIVHVKARSKEEAKKKAATMKSAALVWTEFEPHSTKDIAVVAVDEI